MSEEIDQNLCRVIRLPARPQKEGVSRAYGRNSAIWPSGSVIRWCFLPNTELDNEQQRDIVRKAWKKWVDTGMNLVIKEEDPAQRASCQIRIAFRQIDEYGQQEGSYSYVGTENFEESNPNKHTMNLGWDLSRQPGTAEHEIGHALGLDHEHQHPRCRLVWDEARVIADYRRSQGWSEKDVREQVINRLPVSVKVTATPWDPTSIMHYPFKASLIKSPPEFAAKGVPYNSQISSQDVKTILLMYPRKQSGPKSIGSATEEHPELGLYQSVQPSLEEDSTYSVKPAQSGQYEIIAHGDVEALVIIESVIAGRRAFLIKHTVNSSATLPITLIADKDVSYIVTLRVLETNNAGSFCLLLGERINK